MSGADRRLIQLLLAFRRLWPDAPVELLAVEMERTCRARRELADLGVMDTGGLGDPRERVTAGGGGRAAIVVHGAVAGRRLLQAALDAHPCAELLVDGTCREIIPSPPEEARTVAEALARGRRGSGG
ncbi:MAG: hypothetical protein RLN63_05600, partial [Miltoncostaeaceae bacterium]